LGYRFTEVAIIWVERSGSRVRLIRDLGDVAATLLRLWMSHHRSWDRPFSPLSEGLDRGRSAA
jgi:hypothetical protein